MNSSQPILKLIKPNTTLDVLWPINDHETIRKLLKYSIKISYVIKQILYAIFEMKTINNLLKQKH